MIQTGVRGASESPDCANCPCAREGKPFRAVPAFGGTGSLCIVGEGPGSEELKQGFPFVGPSGGVVNKALKAVGVDRGRVFITNALLCARPTSDEVMEQAVHCCRPRLQADLAMAEPTAICALGGTAMRALELPVAFVSQARGTVQRSPLYPVPCIGSIHPAALLRGGAGEMTSGGKQKMGVDAQALFIFADIAKAYKVADGQVTPEWSDDILVVHEPAEVEAALFALLVDIYTWGMLGLDLEWIYPGRKNALDALGAEAHHAQITWVGIGCEKRAVSFAWGALVESGQLAVLQAAMEDESLAKLSHNKQADKAIWEAQVGPIKGRYLDSMLAHHAVCPGIDHDLQQVASQYLCIPPWKVDHARAVAEYAAAQKAEAKEEKAREKEAKKAEKKAAHEARNEALHAEKLARKAAKQAEHEARNAAAKAEKEARKAARVDGAVAVRRRRVGKAVEGDQGDDRQLTIDERLGRRTCPRRSSTSAPSGCMRMRV